MLICAHAKQQHADHNPPDPLSRAFLPIPEPPSPDPAGQRLGETRAAAAVRSRCV
jgi:hypothetical protein